ncbi:MAG TPA: hypothetical protein ENH65_12365, partial [Candidatus Aminicenantes bacterium]|nr:hypothetical protein [Candidatus Aminicenantes bacterium]
MIVYAVVGWMVFAIVLLFLIAVFLVSKAKIKNLEKCNRELIDEKSKLSDQVQIKSMAVNRLTKEVKRLEKENTGCNT